MKAHTAPVTAADVLRGFGQFLALASLYGWQEVRNVARTAQHVARLTLSWLKGTHTFAPGQSDPEESITLTGWQYITFGAGLLAVALLLSCEI